MTFHQLYVQQIEVPEATIGWSVEIDANPVGPLWLAKPGDIVAYLNGLSPIIGVAGGLPGQEPVIIDVPPGQWYIVSPGPIEGRYRLTRPLRNGEWFPLRLKRFSPSQGSL